MKIHKGIFIASIAIPVLVFSCFLLLSLVVLVLSQGDAFAAGVMIIVGGIYALITLCITFPSTYIWGYPLCKLAVDKNHMSIWFAALSGSGFGAISLVLFAGIIGIIEGSNMPIETDYILFFCLFGGLGGLINGLIIWFLVIRPNKDMQSDLWPLSPFVHKPAQKTPVTSGS